MLGAFQSPTAPNTILLLEPADTVLERLRSPSFALPKPLVKAVKVDPEELESEVERLREATKTSGWRAARCRRPERVTLPERG